MTPAASTAVCSVFVTCTIKTQLFLAQNSFAVSDRDNFGAISGCVVRVIAIDASAHLSSICLLLDLIRPSAWRRNAGIPVVAIILPLGHTPTIAFFSF